MGEPEHASQVAGCSVPYSVLRCRAGGNTRTYRTVNNEAKNQRYSKPVSMVDDDQGSCVLLSITENATNVVRYDMIFYYQVCDMRTHVLEQ